MLESIEVDQDRRSANVGRLYHDQNVSYSGCLHEVTENPKNRPLFHPSCLTKLPFLGSENFSEIIDGSVPTSCFCTATILETMNRRCRRTVCWSIDASEAHDDLDKFSAAESAYQSLVSRLKEMRNLFMN